MAADGAIDLAAAEPTAGDAPIHKRRFGRYTLLFRLASGGMASLYVARLAGSDGFEKLVAIKLIHDHLTANEEFVSMFVDEARLASRISHPNIAQVIELGKVEQTHFIAMEYVEGENLAALLRRRRPAYEIGARIAADVAAGLHAAHELRGPHGKLLNVVHRDVSPQNVLISYKGAVKVVDFGVAMARSNLRETKTGSVRGKFAYMSPEHARGEDEIDRRADIYSLGILLHETTTRRRLFTGKTEAALLEKVLRPQISRPSEILDDYPAALERIVMRALEVDPASRYQTAREMHVDLERFIMDTGHPVLPDQVGELVTEVFGDRIERKKRQLQEGFEAAEHEPSGSVPPEQMNTAGSVSGFSLQGTFTGSRPVWIFGSLALVIILGTLAYVALSSGNGKADTLPQKAPPAASPAPRPAKIVRVMVDAGLAKPITIAISAEPREAKIRFEDKAVANPFKIERAPRKGVAVALISARGYADKKLEVALDRDSQFQVVLRRVERRKQRRRPRGKKLRDDDVLVNPY